MFGLRDDADEAACRCRSEVIDRGEPVLAVTSDDCPGDGRLAASPACRAHVIGALASRDAALVRTASDGLTRTYAGRGAALLTAAGRFADRVAPDDPLADRVRRRPVVAARRATGRAGVVATLAAETGLAAVVADEPATVGRSEDADDDTDRAPCAAWLVAERAPTAAFGRVRPRVPTPAQLTDRWELDGGAVVRRYATDAPRDTLFLRPASARLTGSDRRTLAAAYDRLSAGRVPDPSGAAADPAVGEPDRAPGRAVRAVADGPHPRVTAVLRRHTRELGYLTDLLAVPGVTDATVAAETPTRVTLDGDRLTTNVRFSPGDAATLASRVRAASGRGLSRASPTGHARLAGARVAAVTQPASDGPRFAVRAPRDDAPWTLPRLVATGTLGSRAAATLSFALDRGVSALVAGPRGAGKTTTLAAALWALPPTVPAVLVEDTPELPVESLAAAGRDVTRLGVRTTDDPPLTPTEAVRTALRLGDGALVVGEVRGEEARALYEAMRVGAAADAVLGTIHGGDAAAVRERVVADLGVPEAAFAATDLVVTLDATHQLAELVELRGRESVSFTPLFDRTTDTPVSPDGDRATADGDGSAARDQPATATGVIERGESHLLDDLTEPGETYADAREAVADRATRIDRLVAAGVTDPGAIHGERQCATD